MRQKQALDQVLQPEDLPARVLNLSVASTTI